MRGEIPTEINPTLQKPQSPQELLPVTTQDDIEDNKKSINRSLDDSLFLLVKHDNGSGENWTFPYQEWNSNAVPPESLRDSVNASLTEWFPSHFNVHVLGNAPLGFYTYNYSSEVQKTKADSKIGAKLYLYHAIYIEGDVKINPSLAKDFVWVTKSQLNNYIINPDMQSLLQDILVTQKEFV